MIFSDYFFFNFEDEICQKGGYCEAQPHGLTLSHFRNKNLDLL